MFKKLKELNKTKSIIITSAVVIVLIAIVGATVAWLTSKTNLLKNAFTYGDIEISIIESDTNDGDEDINTNSYEMLPGKEITKDTKVLVKAGSEDCWLFVKLVKENDFDEYMVYSLETNWTLVEGQNNVYYTKVDKSDTDQVFNIMKDNKITVKPELTQTDINHITEDTYPTLEIKAYAVQRNENMDVINSPKDAWELVDNPAS